MHKSSANPAEKNIGDAIAGAHQVRARTPAAGAFPSGFVALICHLLTPSLRRSALMRVQTLQSHRIMMSLGPVMLRFSPMNWPAPSSGNGVMG